MTTTINTKAKWHFLIGLFLVCMCGLMLQIIETRILSVISYYHLAFFAISMAMFGMTGFSRGGRQAPHGGRRQLRWRADRRYSRRHDRRSGFGRRDCRLGRAARSLEWLGRYQGKHQRVVG
jgi:hypothetical protein